jgi:hypothetical protein
MREIVCRSNRMMISKSIHLAMVPIQSSPHQDARSHTVGFDAISIIRVSSFAYHHSRIIITFIAIVTYVFIVAYPSYRFSIASRQFPVPRHAIPISTSTVAFDHSLYPRWGRIVHRIDGPYSSSFFLFVSLLYVQDQFR